MSSELPKRSADTMSDAIAMSSPNGRMSKRARREAEKALATKLFGPGGLTDAKWKGTAPPPTEAELKAHDLKYANFLRSMTRDGKPRKYIREAERLESLWKGGASC